MSKSDENKEDGIAVWHHGEHRTIYITEEQKEFTDVLKENLWRICITQIKCKITNKKLDIWRSDDLFWSYLASEKEMDCKARGLTEAYIKSRTFETIEGKTVTSEQLRAMNLGARVLGIGVSSAKFSLDATPVSVVFNDGLDKKPETNEQKPDSN